ncbi:hypothetical protein NV379_02735 [Paenibacillus sp. N1-5-1-14]|uniref:hypothetical protein n=1 Tax=Paenibacillus radicibacter TaxID=2972488 RepID=UPI002158A781|nr:hypothetical protein [Paenibacillus radicibacter]MCR8641563.1 hypothetical protein [Paenibacillus radicibacter]
MNNNIFLNSPVDGQSFIWMAAYQDGTFLSEFNYDNLEANDFYSIDKNNLVRFGLVGYSMNHYFEVNSGIFKIAGQRFEIAYVVGEKEYSLTGQNITYNDIITYKNASTTININGGQQEPPRIDQYNLGYKINLNIDNVNFYFKPILCMPYGEPAYISVHLVSDQDLNGKLCIKKSGAAFEEIDAPMEANEAYKVNWELKI